MDYTIQLPHGFTPSTIIQKGNPQEMKLILEYGERLLISHQQIVHSQITDIKLKDSYKIIDEQTQTINTLERKQQEDIDNITNSIQTKHNEELSRIKKEKDIIINNLQDELLSISLTQNKNIQKIINDHTIQIKKDHEDEILRLKTELNSLKGQQQNELIKIRESTKRESDEYNNKIITRLEIQNKNEEEIKQWMVKTFENVLTYHNNNISNTHKGIIGESIVRKILEDYYTSATVLDLSHKGQQADILFQDDNPNISCLIEVKKKKEIKKEDIDKFERDVKNKLNDINCALFVSLDAKCIPKKGDFYLEIQSKIPILYIYLQNPQYIRLSIEILKFIITKITSIAQKKISKVEFENDLSNIFTDLYKNIEKTRDKIRTSIENLKKQMNNLEKTEKILDDKLKKIDEFCNMYDVLHSEIKNDKNLNFSEDEIEQLRVWVKDNMGVPLKKEINKILNMNTYQSVNKNVGNVQKLLKKYLSDL